MVFSSVTSYFFSLFQIIGNLLIWIISAQLTFTTIGTICNAITIKFGKKTKPEPNKVIVITGATAGFGLLLTKHFYKLGFSVVGGYFDEREFGYKELNDIRVKRYDGSTSSVDEPHIFIEKIDVRSEESILIFRNQVNKLIEREKLKLFSLINNAGIGNAGAFEWMSPGSITDVLDTNLRGTMIVTRHFMKNIIKNKGRVVNVSSCTYLFPGRGVCAYGTTKAAVTSFSELLNEDLKLHGASCCCIMAGNFISVSNIVYTLYRSVQDSCRRLSDEESSIFKRSIHEQNSIVTKLLRKKLQSEKRDIGEIASQFRIDLPTIKEEEKMSFIERFKETFFRILTPMDGRSKTLESSNLADIFELAICSKNPPIRLYAGNQLYTYVLGPSMEFMAPISRVQLKTLINELIFRV